MPSNEFYTKCANILKRVLERNSNLKKECYRTTSYAHYYPVLRSIINNKLVLSKAIQEAGFNTRNKYLSLVYAYEVLINNSDSINGVPINKGVLQRLRSVFRGSTQKKFIRINTLKGDRRDLADIDCIDTVIPNVYEVTRKVSDHPGYLENKFFIQNLASCFPAFILNPLPGSEVIDACAAPGNKTTHLAAIMENKGMIYAIEKDEQRYKTLQDMILKSGASIVDTQNKDFLTLDPEEYHNVKYILLDPSCTGSGIHDDYKRDEERIRKISEFQKLMLSHAMKFKKVEKIVYSTCSIHEEENEDVVKWALENNTEFLLEEIPDYWAIRGNSQYSFYKDVIRCNKGDGNGTIGFFVALFKRKE
ncbi:putative 28S rRNA (cytosine-C(5))-methyltransferase [Astathelohania contejeani]|uniref:28S rRNA (Cytosine-C(5))-methyltransferase n=1 Tax=Astathelohania contejeani TaxID=164912 RepID=A0ABQ7HY19_9MICR|nr:putative 28S rRNA (cytosine-C(5))-methyltransferase [Thelohania contejeani]